MRAATATKGALVFQDHVLPRRGAEIARRRRRSLPERLLQDPDRNALLRVVNHDQAGANERQLQPRDVAS